MKPTTMRFQGAAMPGLPRRPVGTQRPLYLAPGAAACPPGRRGPARRRRAAPGRRGLPTPSAPEERSDCCTPGSLVSATWAAHGQVPSFVSCCHENLYVDFLSVRSSRFVRIKPV